MLYKNFMTLTSFFSNSITEKKFYSFNHFYNPGSYQVRSAHWAGMSATQNFYSTFKQNNVTPSIYQNFNNRKNCPPICQYRHFSEPCVGLHLAKDCSFNAAALGFNSFFFGISYSPLGYIFSAF